MCRAESWALNPSDKPMRADEHCVWLQAWEAPGTGLLISERLENCPPQLAPPLMRALFDEIRQAAKDGASPVRAPWDPRDLRNGV